MWGFWQYIALIFVIYFYYSFIRYEGAGLFKSISKEFSRLKRKWNEETEEEWLEKTEPKYRYLHDYPPDWYKRQRYIIKKYDNKCAECGSKHQSYHGHIIFHVHHIVPLKKGGDNSFENLTYLCEYCHAKKHPHMKKPPYKQTITVKYPFTNTPKI